MGYGDELEAERWYGEKLGRMGEAMRSLSVRDATERITAMVLELCENRK